MSNSEREKDDGPSQKLRFPEFDGLPIHPVCLGDVTEEPSTRNLGQLPSEFVMGVRKDEGIVPMEGRLIAENTSRYKIVKKDWFAYNPMRLKIGSIARWQGQEDVLVSPDYVVFRCRDEPKLVKVLPAYLDQFRGSDEWNAFVNGSGDGGVRIRIYFRDLARMPLLLPNPDEQQVIVACLKSVDDLIEAETEKLAAWRDHKTGLMQQMFAPSDKSIPSLRFPKYKSGGAWTHKPLGPNTTKVGSGTTPRGGSSVYSSSGRPFLRSQNIGWGRLRLEELAYIDEALHAASAASEVQTGDVLLNITGASIGRSTVADSRVSGGNVNQHVCIIRLKQKGFLPEYLCHFLVSPYGQAQIDSFQAGGNRQGLNFEQIRSFSIPAPPDIDEQKCIADCLSVLDLCITSQIKRIEGLRAHKSGLMQKLFPRTRMR